jgi:hypothetical protein
MEHNDATVNEVKFVPSLALIKALAPYGQINGNEVTFDDLRLSLRGTFAMKEAPPPSKSSALRVVNWPAQLASKKFCGTVFLDDGILELKNSSGEIRIHRGRTEVTYPDFTGYTDDTAALVASLQKVSDEKITALFTSQYYRGPTDLLDVVKGDKELSPAPTLLLAHAAMATLCTLSDLARLSHVSCFSGKLLSPKVTEYVDRIYFSNLTGSLILSEGEMVKAEREKKVLVPNSNYLCALFAVDVPPEGCLLVTSTRLTGFKEGSSPENFHNKEAIAFCDKLVGREVVGWVGGMASSPRFYIAISPKKSQSGFSPDKLYKFIQNLYAAAVEILIHALDLEPCPSRVLQLGEDFDNWIEPKLAPAPVKFFH